MDSLIQKIDKIKRDLYLAQKNILDLEMEKMSIEQAIKRMSIATTNDTIINNQDLLPLNQKQREIVDSTADNILVVACPGSGKTHTIISRYINLVVKKNIDPNKIEKAITSTICSYSPRHKRSKTKNGHFQLISFEALFSADQRRKSK